MCPYLSQSAMPMGNKPGLKVQTIATLSIISVAILLLTSLFPLVHAAVPWTKNPGDVYLKEDVIYDELFVINSWVIKNSDTDYEMWYTHSRAEMTVTELATSITTILSDNLISALTNLDLAGLLTEMAAIDAAYLWNFMTSSTTVIGYATSSDGINWSVVDDQVLAGTPGAWENYGAPCVIKDGGTYEMWFTHSDAVLDQTSLATYFGNLDDPDPTVVRDAIIALMNCTSSAIGYATSSDGMDWGTPQLNAFDYSSGGIWDMVVTPCVIKNASNDYAMWYTYAETSLTADYLDTILDPVNIGSFDANELLNILNNISSVIGYATYDGVDWTIANPNIIYGASGGLWDSVATPCVIKNGGVYEIWYSSFTSDLNSTSFSDLFTAIQGIETDIMSLWSSFASGDLDTFLIDFDAFFGALGPFDSIRPYLDDTGIKISYATSLDGESWTTQNPAALVGNSGSPWSSVAFPCVVWEDGTYQMWFTQGFEPLTAQNIVSLLDGTNLPIGYATAIEGIDMVSGWNFIGLPEVPVSPNTEEVLSGIIANVQTVWAYDASTGLWSYFTTIPGAPQGDLTEMDVGVGYWIELIDLETLIIFGVEPIFPYNIDLVVGWNLISIPETPSSSATEDLLSDIIANVQTVWAYDAATGLWSYFTTIPGAPQGDLTEMTECKAYWVEMTASNTLTIN